MSKSKNQTNDDRRAESRNRGKRVDALPNCQGYRDSGKPSLMRFMRGETSLRLDKADVLAEYLGLELVKKTKGEVTGSTPDKTKGEIMGTVYKKTVTKPLPAGAKIIVRKGQRLAEWNDAKGKTPNGTRHRRARMAPTGL